MISINEIILNKTKLKNNWSHLLFDKNSENRFLYLLWPLLEYSHKKLSEIVVNNDSVTTKIKPGALQDFILNLYKLYVLPSFSRVCVLEMHGLKNKLKGSDGSERFNHFIVLAEKFFVNDFLSKYNNLYLRINTLFNQFIFVAIELIERFFIDCGDIKLKILGHCQLQKISLLKIIPAGDRHANGRQVYILKLLCHGKKCHVVYKPRSMDIDLACIDFLGWINQNSKLNFSWPKTLSYNQYGWQEYIEYRPCKSKAQCSSFYCHLGGMLCIAQLLGAEDIHAENLIAHSQYPIIVDYECFLTPCVQLKKTKNPRFLVIGSLILPYLITGDAEHHGVDLSVIGHTVNQLLPFSSYVWSNAGTDQMHLIKMRRKTKQTSCRSKLNNNYVNPIEFKKYFLKGYNEVYQFIQSNKKLLLRNTKSPLSIFRDKQTRLILRQTNYYTKLLLESCHPFLLFDIEALKKHFAHIENILKKYPEYASIISSEKQDMANYDVPIFRCSSTSSQIFDSNSDIKSITLQYAGYERIMNNLEMHWGDADCYVQTTFIKNSFLCYGKNTAYKTPRNKHLRLAKYSRKHKINNKEITTLVLEYSDLIYKNAIISDGKINWPSIKAYKEKITNNITDESLYNGNAGIILALVMVGKYFNIKKYIDLGSLYASNMEKQILNNNFDMKMIGLYDGMAGILYVLLNIANAIDVPELLINFCIKSLHAQIDLDNGNLDIMSGLAGVLSVILKCKSLYCNDLLNKIENLCVEKIIGIIEKNEHDFSKSFLASYAHGITGIAWALAKYNALKENKDIVHIIYLLLKKEDEFFHHSRKRWLDMRGDKLHKYIDAWCHGSIGIGLSSIDILDKFRHENSLNYAEIAWSNTIKYGFDQETSLCHGYLGSLNFLMECRQRNTVFFSQQKYEHCINYVHYKLKRHEYSFYGVYKLFEPGLMTGLCGVLITYLKLLDYNQHPSVLMI